MINFIVMAPRESKKRLVHPQDITYNDVAVCGSDTITSTLVSNRRFKDWIDAHKFSYAQASAHIEEGQIARSVVDTVLSCVPLG